MSSNNPNDVPEAAAFGQWRASMAQAGWSQAQLNEAYGQQVNGRTWKELSDEGKSYLKNAPKAT